jgi:hypothetical protein
MPRFSDHDTFRRMLLKATTSSAFSGMPTRQDRLAHSQTFFQYYNLFFTSREPLPFTFWPSLRKLSQLFFHFFAARRSKDGKNCSDMTLECSFSTTKPLRNFFEPKRITF